MRQSFVLTFENGLPKGTAQQKGETVRYKNGKPFVFHYKKSSVESARQLFAYKLKPYAPSTPITGCVALSVTLFFSVKERAKWGKHKPSRPDADNYCKELVDVMGSLGWWIDDAQIVKLKIEKRYAEKASIFIHCEEVFDDVIQ